MPKILVVDDIADNIQLLRFCLEDDGYSVAEALSGEACLDYCQSNDVDLILLDMMMPGLSGLETLAQLKADPHTVDIPVIMVSANDTEDLIVDALDIGAHDYVSKPVVYPILAARARSAMRLKQAKQALSEANYELQQLASTDTLTSLYNRRYFLQLSSVELAKAQRMNRALSIIMIDADNFKAINDNHGHLAGDNALIVLANSCTHTCRASDIIGRLGGEEFFICCPDTELEGAIEMAERIRLLISQTKVSYKTETGDRNKELSFTVSMGVSQYRQGDTLATLMAKADKQLYRAKDSGRNCIASN